jgi:glucose 1-dehydrogenase
MMPIARAGTPEEVAEAVLFLLSDASSYTTGTNVRVAGGR